MTHVRNDDDDDDATFPLLAKAVNVVKRVETICRGIPWAEEISRRGEHLEDSVSKTRGEERMSSVYEHEKRGKARGDRKRRRRITN